MAITKERDLQDYIYGIVDENELCELEGEVRCHKTE